MDIITTTETEEISQIRLLVSIAFETDDLPDEIITLDAFLGDANLATKELLPNWESYEGDNKRRLKSIVRKLTAIKLLSSSERVAQRTLPDLSESKDLVKAKDLILQYRNEIINSVTFLKDVDSSSGNSSGTYIVAAVVV